MSVKVVDIYLWILTQSLFVFVSVSGLTEKIRIINNAKSNSKKRTEIKHLQALLARDKEIQEQFVLMTSL